MNNATAGLSSIRREIWVTCQQNAFLYGVNDMPLVIQTAASLINGFLNHLESFCVFLFILMRRGFQIYAGEVSTTFTRGMRR